MPSFVSPGVYVVERDFSLYVPNLSTTILGMVGTAQKGPLNTAVQITSALQFIQTFGEPSPSMYGPYAALQFLQEGEQLYFVRVAGPLAAQSLFQIASDETGGADLAAVVSSASGPFDTSVDQALTINEVDYSSGARVLTARSVTLSNNATLSAATAVTDITGTGGYAGWGFTASESPSGVVRLISKVKSSQLSLFVSGLAAPELGFNQDDEAFGADAKTLPAVMVGSQSGPFDISGTNDTLVLTEVDNRSGISVLTDRNITLAHGAALSADDVMEDLNTQLNAIPANIEATISGNSVVLSALEIENDLFGFKVSGNAANTLGLDISSSHFGALAKWLITAQSPGAWGNAISVFLDAGSLSGLRLRVYQSGVLQETWDNLSQTPGAAAYVETIVNAKSNLIIVSDNTLLAGPPKLTVAAVPGNYLILGADDLAGVTDASYVGEIDPNGGATGMQNFANAETIDMNLLVVPGVSSADVINAGIDLCATRGDAMMIVDSPFGLSSQNVVKWHNGQAPYDDHQAFDSSYAALYWPWMQIFDPVNNVKVWTPPSGNVARAYAFTDRTTETWFAPAGTQRGHLVSPLKLEHSATHGERDFLYGNSNAVNPIIQIPKQGITIWGQRTLQRAPTSLDRVSVRRMLLYLEKVIATATRFLVFEPNDPTLWGQFKDLVTPFVNSVKQRRGLYDFKVICDKTTNTPDVVDRNEMHGSILLKPTKAAEFIIITFALTSTGAEFSTIQGF